MACIKVLVPFGNDITEKLGKCGLPQATFDLCLFIGKKVVAILYINDQIFLARNEMDIGDLTIQLYTEGVDIEQEDDDTGFLAVHIEHKHKTGFLHMTQRGLIKQVLETLGLDVGTANGKFTPSRGNPLVKHAHGDPASGNFN